MSKRHAYLHYVITHQNHLAAGPLQVEAALNENDSQQETKAATCSLLLVGWTRHTAIINIINKGKRRNQIFAQSKRIPNERSPDYECTNVAALWLEYEDMKQRTSSWCVRHNENKILIWIFHGGTCVTIAYVCVFWLLYIIQRVRVTWGWEFILTFHLRKSRIWSNLWIK